MTKYLKIFQSFSSLFTPYTALRRPLLTSYKKYYLINCRYLFLIAYTPMDPKNIIPGSKGGKKIAEPEITQIEDRGSVYNCPWGTRLGDDKTCEGIFLASLGIPHLQGRQREPGNLVLKHFTPIKCPISAEF